MSEVPRETPLVPDSARGVFPSATLTAVGRYAELLATDGVVRGLIGPREIDRIWDRHLLNCAALAAAVPEGARVADVGSGAGLPGLVLALARPDLTVTLIEPLLRRTTFLAEVVDRLRLRGVSVVRSRAEDLAGSVEFDVVASRAVAPLERLLGWCMPLTAPDGVALAMKGSSAADEVAAVRPVLARRGWAEPEVLELPSPAGPVRAVRVRWADPTRVPWRAGPGRERGSSPRRRTGR